MPRISNTSKFFIARTFSSMYFWAGIAIPYLLYRDLTIQQAVTTIAIYAISNVILEYPTGVIGDYLGHKTSLAMGGVFFFIGFLIMAQKWPSHYIYYFASFINAVGDSLESGSDEALLHTVTKNFEYDLGNYKVLKGIIKLISTSIAGLFAVISLPLTVIVTGFVNLIAAISILSIKVEPGITNYSKKITGNIFDKAIEGLSFVKSVKGLTLLIISVSIIFGYDLSLKTIIGSFDEIFSIDIKYIGFMVGLSYFTASLGYKFEKNVKFIKIHTLLLITILSLLISSRISNPFYIFGLLLLGAFTNATIVMRIKIRLHELIKDSIRASVISLHNLIARLISSIYLFIAGYVLDFLTFSWLVYTTIIIFVISLTLLLIAQKIIGEYKISR